MTVYRAGRRRPLPAKTSTFKKISETKQVSESEINNFDTPGDSQSLLDMLARVQQHVDMFQYEEARDLCLKAILLSPEDADIRYQLGSICLELGDFQGGFENIRLSLNLEPETTPDRFFAFAQLIPGREAVQVYEHGLKVYSEISESPSSEIKRKVSTACCAAAEIFMTDLCDDDDAESQCSFWLEKALITDPNNPEVYRVMADLRVCQQNSQDARENVLKACQLWSQELDKLMNPDENDSTLEIMAEFPSYESRISAAKILIEIGDPDLLEQATAVLEQLLKEDDSILMTWYLLALTLKTSQNIPALEDAILGSLRVSRRDGHLQYPSLHSDDELIQEIVNWAGELGMKVDLDAIERDEEEDAVLDLEEALEEAERIDQENE